MISKSATSSLRAGAATVDLTPDGSVFLFGYPNVPRYSTGVHDRLECSALYLESGDSRALLIANDLIYVGTETVREVRRRLNAQAGVPERAIAITATHTHSGPVVVNSLSNERDPIVPKVDPDYLERITCRMVEAALAAVASAVPVQAGLTVAHAEGIGTNRHDPKGPADPEVPVLLLRSDPGRMPVACVVVYSMHPTVLHEDSTLISADFPHFTRRYLHTKGGLPETCPILYHNGASGNQSPRYVTRANTFTEAQRLGELLGETISRALPDVVFDNKLRLDCRSVHVDLDVRALPSVTEAEAFARTIRARFDSLVAQHAPRPEVRTAECDWFGAEKTVALARAAADGRREQAVGLRSPAEIQMIALGPWKFVMWPGEFFVEYALEVKRRSPDTFIITLANGELQGYIVTQEAVTRGFYEATNALFSAGNGPRFVDATLELLAGRAASQQQRLK